MTRTPGIDCADRLSTSTSRPVKGTGSASNVFRPTTTMLPMVVALNQARSAGRCQGTLVPDPMTRFCDMAAIALNGFTGGVHQPSSRARPGPVLALERWDATLVRRLLPE